MNDIAKVFICSSGWIGLLLTILITKNNEKKEKEKEIQNLKEKLLEKVDELINLHTKNNATEQDYFILKEKIIDLIDIQNEKIDKNIRIKLSDNLELLLYKFRQNEPYTDTQKTLKEIIKQIEFK